ncbi:hypothetical protein ACG2F4_01620 [Halalkalibaculum sp. DA3122]|uniref:hypothetical protein n=1 Tax=Halalkalibaculum sp. DA384 TaxID=3373606 RepID=UPI0037549A10
MGLTRDLCRPVEDTAQPGVAGEIFLATVFDRHEKTSSMRTVAKMQEMAVSPIAL